MAPRATAADERLLLQLADAPRRAVATLTSGGRDVIIGAPSRRPTLPRASSVAHLPRRDDAALAMAVADEYPSRPATPSMQRVQHMIDVGAQRKATLDQQVGRLAAYEKSKVPPPPSVESTRYAIAAEADAANRARQHAAARAAVANSATTLCTTRCDGPTPTVAAVAADSPSTTAPVATAPSGVAARFYTLELLPPPGAPIPRRPLTSIEQFARCSGPGELTESSVAARSSRRGLRLPVRGGGYLLHRHAAGAEGTMRSRTESPTSDAAAGPVVPRVASQLGQGRTGGHPSAPPTSPSGSFMEVAAPGAPRAPEGLSVRVTPWGTQSAPPSAFVSLGDAARPLCASNAACNGGVRSADGGDGGGCASPVEELAATASTMMGSSVGVGLHSTSASSIGRSPAARAHPGMMTPVRISRRWVYTAPASANGAMRRPKEHAPSPPFSPAVMRPQPEVPAPALESRGGIARGGGIAG